MKPTLLVIEPYSYIPPDSGGKNRTLHTITELSKRFDLKLITIPTHAKSWFSFIKTGIPYWFSDWSYSKQSETLNQLNQPTYPTILIEYTQLLYLINFFPKSSKKIFTAYDISTVSFWRRLRSEPNIIKRLIGLFRWLEVYIYERKYLPRYNKVIAVTNHDADILKKHFHVKQVEVIENGIDQIYDLP